MAPRQEQAADWREAGSYSPLLPVDRAFLAWEWLRRRADYREAACRRLSGTGRSGPEGELVREPRHWGLHRYEAPDLPATHARPIWTREVHPYVLEVEARECKGGADGVDLARLRTLVTIVPAVGGGEHLLLSDGVRAIRIDVVEGSVRQGPVQLHYRMSGIASAEPPLLSLRRLLALCRRGRFSVALHPPEARAARHILMLRAYDGIVAGAAQREIAALLLSSEAGRERWRVEAPTVRLRVQRLVRSARAMAAGGYLSLLRR